MSKSRLWLRTGWLVGISAIWLCLAGPAEARVEDDSAYSKAQTFSGALRYLRVDLGYEVVEKDPDAAYLLFKYKPMGSREETSGSIEIVQADGKVKVFVQLPKMPEYHERMLSTGLMKKLKTEYGEPPKPAKKPKQDDDDRDGKSRKKKRKGDTDEPAD
ncbi:MAG: hypothetical protein R3B07_12730 [Polyangiaceae bacterium]